jgi:two-component system chemotaxis response regulator CheB
MPLAALQSVTVDYVVRASEIADLLVRAARGELPLSPQPHAALVASRAESSQEAGLAGKPPEQIPEPPSKFTCPECGGSLWEIQEGRLVRYRCHTGHGFTPITLRMAQGQQLEHALWSAMRVLNERTALHKKMAAQNTHRGLPSAAEQFTRRAQSESEQAEVIRQVLAQLDQSPAKSPLPLGEVEVLREAPMTKHQ